jgi:hypothetical protein
MAERVHRLGWGDRAALALLALVVVGIVAGLWWFGMADASMTGCGGG